VKTTAVRGDDGDHYVVNGQKTWTTLGQHANMIFCLVRTDREAKKQEGISFLLVDMKLTPGVDRAPDHHAGRRARGQRSVLHRRARAGRANLVGEENKGWTAPSTC
jgi:alkylation response protein AidB-like acyl-CoA dehydrogenase